MTSNNLGFNKSVQPRYSNYGIFGICFTQKCKDAKNAAIAADQANAHQIELQNQALQTLNASLADRSQGTPISTYVKYGVGGMIAITALALLAKFIARPRTASSGAPTKAAPVKIIEVPPTAIA